MSTKRKTAFTLIELLIYIALVSLFLTAATVSLWDIILGNTKSSVQQEVQENIRYSAQRVLFEIRNANSLGAESSFNVNLAENPNAKISLSAPAPNTPVEFRVSGGILQIKQGSGDWNSLTSSAVEVTDLTFDDVSDASSESVQFILILRYINPSVRSQWEKETTFRGAATLR